MQFETNTKWKIKFLRLTTGTLIGIWTNWLLANNFSENIFQLSTQYNQNTHLYLVCNWIIQFTYRVFTEKKLRTSCAPFSENPKHVCVNLPTSLKPHNAANSLTSFLKLQEGTGKTKKNIENICNQFHSFVGAEKFRRIENIKMGGKKKLKRK